MRIRDLLRDLDLEDARLDVALDLARVLNFELKELVKAGVRVEEGSNPKITTADNIPLEDAKVPLPRSLRTPAM